MFWLWKNEVRTICVYFRLPKNDDWSQMSTMYLIKCSATKPSEQTIKICRWVVYYIATPTAILPNSSMVRLNVEVFAEGKIGPAVFFFLPWFAVAMLLLPIIIFSVTLLSSMTPIWGKSNNLTLAKSLLLLLQDSLFNAIQIQNLTSRRTNEDPLIVWHEDYSINPVWRGIRKQEKCSSLEQPNGNFYQT